MSLRTQCICETSHCSKKTKDFLYVVLGIICFGSYFHQDIRNRRVNSFIPRMVDVELITQYQPQCFIVHHFYLLFLHRSLQYLTSFQFFSHFFLQVKGLLQAMQIFVGKSCFLTPFMSIHFRSLFFSNPH